MTDDTDGPATASRPGRTGRPADGTDLAAGRRVRGMVLLRGLLVVAFGIVTLASPGLAVLALVFVFGSYAILDGVVAIVLGIRHRADRQGWGWAVAQGVISVIAGLVALVLPGPTAVTLLVVVALWAIALGVVTAVSAVQARRSGGAWGWMLVRAVLDVVFGVLLLIWPATGILALLWMLGAFSLVTGAALIGQAFRPGRRTVVG
ncbi:MAG: HdeD family acid-resistance protein [Pseudonocardia sp.]|nr:HdeD family acid-resistance protein [Pseudonocardia sp.]